MAEYLGIGLAREELSIALLSGSSRSLHVRELQSVEYDGTGADLPERAEFAARLAHAGPYSKAALAVALPGEEVFLQPRAVPFTRRYHIAHTLPFEMEDKLPFDVEKGVLDFMVISSEAKGSRIMVAAIERDKLSAVVEPFERRGIRVRLVTIDVLAAAGLHALGVAGPYTLLDVTSSGWKLAICDAGRVLFARAAPVAASHEALEESLARWVRQSFIAAPQGLDPSKVILCGNAAGAMDIPALEGYLSLDVEMFSIELLAVGGGLRTAEGSDASVVSSGDGDAGATDQKGAAEVDAPAPCTDHKDPIAEAGDASGAAVHDEDAPQEAFARAAPGGGERESVVRPAGEAAATGGLFAAAQLAGGHGEINLQKAAMGEERLSQTLFAPVAVGLVLVVALFAALAVGAWWTGVAARAEEHAARQRELEIWRDLFGEQPPPGGSVHLGLESALRELDESGARAALGPDVQWLLRAVYVLSRAVPDDLSLTFGRLSAAAGRFSVDVVARETTSAHIIAESINADGAFSASPQDLKTGAGGETTYTIVMTPRSAPDG